MNICKTWLSLFAFAAASVFVSGNLFSADEAPEKNPFARYIKAVEKAENDAKNFKGTDKKKKEKVEGNVADAKEKQ